MENISLHYYNYKPRLRVWRNVNMALPMVGDRIHIPKEWITEMSKERKADLIFGLDFIVKERFAYFHNNDKGCEWRITLELCEREKI